MGFLNVIKGFFSALDKIAVYFQSKQLLDAGKDTERGKQAENALKDIEHVKKIKQDVADLDVAALDAELHNYKYKGKK